MIKCFLTFNLIYSSFRCKCSHGKQVKPDRMSCDWVGYYYVGGANHITLTMDNKKERISTHRKVLAIDHDYEHNTLFYTVANYSTNTFSLLRYHPENRFSLIFNGEFIYFHLYLSLCVCVCVCVCAYNNGSDMDRCLKCV